MKFTRAALDNPVVFKNGFYRSEKALYVERETQFLDVFAVQFSLYRDFEFVPAVYLRPAGKPGAYRIRAVFVAFGNEIVLIPESGARSDNRHLSEQNVEKLRQLVEARLSQELPYRREILIGIFEHMSGNVPRR